MSSLIYYIYLVGHGKSGGERVFIEDFSTYVTDVISHIQDLKTEYPGVPFFLFGHSMVILIYPTS